MNTETATYFKDRKQWRKWLAKNHDKKTEIWLIHYKKHSKRPGIRHEEGVEEAICFGWIDGQLRKIDDEKFRLRYSPRRPKSPWSRINREKAEAMIRSGKMTAAGLSRIEEAKKTGLWQRAYTNKARERIPSDLKAALSKNNEAWDNFRKFANTYRNMYIGWVVSAKTGETRKKRIDRVVEQASRNKKLIFL
ncbi:MAG: YdeI/OmpD-associated family protein [Candidatus Aminicenantes bacterium]|nr:YdeI/OmpD-associated family protein [Candidatus Aminicenantes bacterium]